jgi:hypothetical protein
VSPEKRFVAAVDDEVVANLGSRVPLRDVAEFREVRPFEWKVEVSSFGQRVPRSTSIGVGTECRLRKSLTSRASGPSMKRTASSGIASSIARRSA